MPRGRNPPAGTIGFLSFHRGEKAWPAARVQEQQKQGQDHAYRRFRSPRLSARRRPRIDPFALNNPPQICYGNVSGISN